MKEKLMEEVRENMRLKSTIELFEIWEENNREQYSDEAFEVVRQLLIERGEVPAPQSTQRDFIHVKFIKARIKSLENRGWGRFRGEGSVLIDDRGVKIKGSRIYAMVIRLGILVPLMFILAVIYEIFIHSFPTPLILLSFLSFQREYITLLSDIISISLALITGYFFIEYVVVKREDIFVPWKSIRNFAADPRRNLLGISLDDYSHCSPTVYRYLTAKRKEKITRHSAPTLHFALCPWPLAFSL